MSAWPVTIACRLQIAYLDLDATRFGALDGGQEIQHVGTRNIAERHMHLTHFRCFCRRAGQSERDRQCGGQE